MEGWPTAQATNSQYCAVTTDTGDGGWVAGQAEISLANGKTLYVLAEAYMQLGRQPEAHIEEEQADALEKRRHD